MLLHRQNVNSKFILTFIFHKACLSVCLDVRVVCHTLVLCQNDSSYDHAVFTIGEPHDSSWQFPHEKRPYRTTELIDQWTRVRVGVRVSSPLVR